ncbi:hypothetical protein [Priestia endophytica]|uniref:Uncharacterized protein n=1 Tax=Priestia endophytica DSM 13796 TaxID=1121089 RepID=A0A1I6C0R9_9BACI|nr:hypothetical protein [Priestia endophytica]KYG33429.1 hypothetical protein AZF06_21530 [Priestia endophytica]SFQ86675.1 hypothetical protein SAMN02745910_04696 [Priestia endophytica DSM 13796]
MEKENFLHYKKELANSIKKFAGTARLAFQSNIKPFFDQASEVQRTIKKLVDTIDWEAIEQYGELSDFIERCAGLGWSMPQQFLIHIYHDAPKENLEEYIVSKINDKEFFLPFKGYMISSLEKDRQKVFGNTLKLIDDGYYPQSALHCFSVIEYLLRSISSSDKSRWSKKLINYTKSELDQFENNELDLLMLTNIFTTIEKILLTEMFANHNDKPTGILLSRNELSHGMANEEKVNKVDCYKLLMVILTLSEAKNSLEKNENETKLMVE